MTYPSRDTAIRCLSGITDRLASRLPEAAVREVQENIKHGEEGLALEWLLDALYEHQVVLSQDERRELARVADFFETPKHFLVFWPEKPPNREDHGGNDDPPRLFGGALEPLTYTIGFLHAPIEQVLQAFRRSRRGWANRLVQTWTTGSLRDHLLALDPLHFGGEARVLVTATEALGWTAVFDNNSLGIGVVPTAAGLAERLGVRGYAVRSVPPYSPCHRNHGSRHFFVLGPETANGVLRRVSVSEGPTRQWTFDYHGDPQPFEDTEAYSHPHQDERFTNDMLRGYARAAGLDPWNEDFYRTPAQLVDAPRATRSWSLTEARTSLGIRSAVAP